MPLPVSKCADTKWISVQLRKYCTLSQWDFCIKVLVSTITQLLSDIGALDISANVITTDHHLHSTPKVDLTLSQSVAHWFVMTTSRHGCGLQV